jgi:hypothetical protein
MSASWSGPAHQHEYPIRTTLPVQTAGVVLSWTDYRECACGHRVPDAVTEVSVPLIGDGGVQRLRSHMLQPDPELEAEL